MSQPEPVQRPETLGSCLLLLVPVGWIIASFAANLAAAVCVILSWARSTGEDYDIRAAYQIVACTLPVNALLVVVALAQRRRGRPRPYATPVLTFVDAANLTMGLVILAVAIATR